jgi:hypothetical protein
MPSSVSAPEAPPDALAAFRQRLASGRFTAVLGRALRRTLRDAAAEAGLDAEVGAVRLALARLLTEERDPSRLAAAVARLTAVSVQAARLRQPTGADSELDALQAALFHEIEALDAEFAAKRASPLAISAESPSPVEPGRVPAERVVFGERVSAWGESESDWQ